LCKTWFRDAALAKPYAVDVDALFRNQALDVVEKVGFRFGAPTVQFEVLFLMLMHETRRGWTGTCQLALYQYKYIVTLST
jgi:hypothetical protein